jgi:DNA-binding LacI/PurR family transcriptional regulator
MHAHDTDSNYVMPDNQLAGWDAASRLLELGHRNCVFIGSFRKPEDDFFKDIHFKERFYGFRQRFLYASLPEPEWIPWDVRVPSGTAPVMELLSSIRSGLRKGLPSAFLVAGQCMVREILAAAAVGFPGWKIFESVSMLSFEDGTLAKVPELACASLSPSLVARELAALLERLDDPPSIQPLRISLPMQLLDGPSLRPAAPAEA